MEYFLQTKRLGFRCWREEDLPLAMGLWGDPEVTALMGGPFDADAVRARLAREIARMQENGIQYWPVFLLEDDRHVGCAGLQLYREEERTYELGYHLRQKFWGQGMAKEAARAVIEYAFGVLGLESLFAGHHPSNAASRKVLLSLGFAYAGEELYPPSGMIEPTYRLRKPQNRPK
jgi:[ribosomal protein S5]-alanine N-acetyltransferase